MGMAFRNTLLDVNGRNVLLVFEKHEMEKYFVIKIINRLFKVLLLIQFTGCNCQTVHLITESAEEPDYRAMKYTAAIIKDYRDLDGCTYLLELENGEKLHPVNLHDSLRVNNLKVWMKYSVTDDITVCMAGKPVQVNDIKARLK
jgi:hypothetical protein